jgi:hypothetical protein
MQVRVYYDCDVRIAEKREVFKDFSELIIFESANLESFNLFYVATDVVLF